MTTNEKQEKATPPILYSLVGKHAMYVKNAVLTVNKDNAFLNVSYTSDIQMAKDFRSMQDAIFYRDYYHIQAQIISHQQKKGFE